jgi:hypothetical protein
MSGSVCSLDSSGALASPSGGEPSAPDRAHSQPGSPLEIELFQRLLSAPQLPQQAAASDELIPADGEGDQPAAAAELEMRLFEGLMSTPQSAREWTQFAMRGLALQTARGDASTDGDESRSFGGLGYLGDDLRRTEADVSSQLSSPHAIDGAPVTHDIGLTAPPDLTSLSWWRNTFAEHWPACRKMAHKMRFRSS